MGVTGAGRQIFFRPRPKIPKTISKKNSDPKSQFLLEKPLKMDLHFVQKTRKRHFRPQKPA
jgi:hypothetical protein